MNGWWPFESLRVSGGAVPFVLSLAREWSKALEIEG